MSYWTHILGVVEVSVMGRTQHEKTYILNTVLDHLPRVTGSEGDMHVVVNLDVDENISASHDEFGMRTDNLVNYYGDKSRRDGWLRYSDTYYLTIYGNLRDRVFRETFREFQKWLTRLAKRVCVEQVNITIRADDRRKPYYMHYGFESPYCEMFEDPSWVSDDGEPTWFEYLMWEREPKSWLPLHHVYKYYNDDDIDREMERRRRWKDGDELLPNDEK